MSNLCIYLISRINSNYHSHHIQLCNQIKLHTKSDIFIPHLYNPFDILPKEIEYHVFMKDLTVMNQSTLAIISFPIGKDCSSEIGWFHGNSKKCIGIIWESINGISSMEQYKNIESDWMVKGFISSIIVIGCKNTYNEILKDTILKNKVYYLHSFEGIGSLLK